MQNLRDKKGYRSEPHMGVPTFPLSTPPPPGLGYSKNAGLFVMRYNKRYLRALATSYWLDTIQSLACSSHFKPGGSISDVSYDPTPDDNAVYR